MRLLYSEKKIAAGAIGALDKITTVPIWRQLSPNE
jgi:hypothetical protein